MVVKVGDTVKVIRWTRNARRGSKGTVRTVYAPGRTNFGNAYVYFGVGRTAIIKIENLEVVKRGERRGED